MCGFAGFVGKVEDRETVLVNMMDTIIHRGPDSAGKYVDEDAALGFLYLDTHPCDSEALAYFHEMSAHRNDALKQYASAYGPLTVDTADYSCAERWNWINEPWPWQEGGC